MSKEPHTASGDDDPMMRAIGRVAGMGASLEWALIDLHATLLDSPRAHVAVAGEAFEAANQGCLALAKHIGDLVDAHVRSVVSEAAAAWETRGSVMHGLWLAEVSGELAGSNWLSMRMRKSGLQVTAWSVEGMNALADRLKASFDAVDQLENELREPAVTPAEVSAEEFKVNASAAATGTASVSKSHREATR